MVGVVIYLFFATAIGIFLGTVRTRCRSSACCSCWSSADEHALGQQHAAGEHAALAGDGDAGSPSTHFVSFAQSILYRGAGLGVVWPQFLAVKFAPGSGGRLAPQPLVHPRPV
jgi:ABC-2 type transport system permease protein